MADTKRNTYTTYNEFCQLVTEKEGKKSQQTVAQVKETLRVMRNLFVRAGVDLYKVVDSTPLEVFRGRD